MSLTEMLIHLQMTKKNLPVFDVDVVVEASHTYSDIAQAGLELFLK